MFHIVWSGPCGPCARNSHDGSLSRYFGQFHSDHIVTTVPRKYNSVSKESFYGLSSRNLLTWMFRRCKPAQNSHPIDVLWDESERQPRHRREDGVCREAKCNVPIAAISLEFRQGGGGKARHLRGTGLQGNLP
ncbi:hypothetical protein TNCV_1937381 [Trichonephila clavipes]|nr:hypothetical protein TNCV_1937381 [Trichonephila clavipes]